MLHPMYFWLGDCPDDVDRHVAGEGAASVGYDKNKTSTATASLVQIRAQFRAVILMFTTDDAPDKFRTSDQGWMTTVVTVAKKRADGALDTITTGKVSTLDLGCRRSAA